MTENDVGFVQDATGYYDEDGRDRFVMDLSEYYVTMDEPKLRDVPAFWLMLVLNAALVVLFAWLLERSK